MPTILHAALLLILFIALGAAGDVAVRNIKFIASVLKMRLFAFGILLGMITTLPELSVGINAIIDDAPALAVGNLLGGTMVILGLILGVSLILNRRILTEGRLMTLVPQAAVIFLPLPLGLDGRFGLFDGIVMIGSYFGLIFYLYQVNHSLGRPHLELIDRKRISRALLLSIFGIVAVLLVSHWIVEISLGILERTQISRLVMGVLIFSIGTNLPEITVVITSWRKKASELSLSHLLGSAFTNALVLGSIIVIRPVTFTAGPAYWTLAIFSGLILAVFLIFHQSGKRLDRREGIILLSIYAAFLLGNILIAK